MRDRRQAAIYFGALLFFNGLGDPTGLISVPLLFILKDRLHAGPEAVAVFEALTLIPAYGAVLFGLLRDRWSPFGRRDRGYFALAAPVAVASYLWLAAVPLSYAALLSGIIGAMISYQMLDSAIAALVTTVAQRESATGRLSALSETIETVVHIVSVLAGGWMVSHLTTRTIFLLAGAFTVPIFLQAFWSPAAVFPKYPPAEQEPEAESVKALLRKVSPKLWPVAIILLLFNFSPGWGTPLYYYLIDKVHLSSAAFGVCRAVQYVGILIATALYGTVCSRLRPRQLLALAITINIFPGFLYLLIGGKTGAIAVSTVVGLVSGFATVAVFDLLMRCCPRGLEGAGTALGHSTFGLAGSIGDVLGATVYSHGSFALCLAMDAVATALILPLLGRLPEAVVSTPDGEPLALSVTA
ncbi:MAG TPA: MFS transporter [Bryobacteraceae bacterium]|nr:MFS transporter [Bryobacteraceae bacterium]